MLNFKFIFSTIILLFITTIVISQVNSDIEAQAKQRMEKVGGNEDDVRKKLLERGIDIDKVNYNNPEEMLKLQTALEEIEKEIAAESSNNNVSTDSNKKTEQEIQNQIKEEVQEEIQEVASSTAKEVIESVEDGATTQEALAEEIIDAQELDRPATKIYGQHIFRDKEISEYSKANDVAAPSTYILAEGDKLSVSIWGISELDAIYEIKKDGYIKPNGIPRINLKGITLGKAKELLSQRFGNYYVFNKDQFEVVVSTPRTITVNIVGEVLNSGSFTFPAINTAFNALAAAGGPSDIGSVRNIKIIRQGGDVKNMDIYEFLLNPSTAKDFYLNDNDYIHVGVAERLISITGAIRRPYIYELKKTENLKDLIKYSGGFTPNAYKGNIQVKRFVDDTEKIFDVNYGELEKTGRSFELNPGDKVNIGIIPTSYKNFVNINGAVDLPGTYELEPGMKILDLLEKGVLSEDSKIDVAYLLRTDQDGTLKYNKISIEEVLKGKGNIELIPKDKLIIFSKRKFVNQYEIGITGSVRNPASYKYNEGANLKISDLVLLAGGLKEDATDFAYLYRKSLTGSKEKEYIKIDIKNAIENPESGDNLILEPNDRIQVFSVLTYKDEFEISVIGAVRNPDNFVYDSSEKLKIDDLILLVGGLRQDAADFAYIYRTKPSNVKETEYIRINIKNALENPTSPDNLVLEPKDRLEVLSKLEFIETFPVRVGGAVRNPGEYQYHPSLSLKDVLTLSGGLKLIASNSRIDIFRMVINKDEPTKTIVATIEVDENLDMVSDGNLQLEPFDQIIVRNVPEFEFQRFVTIKGEVKYPGLYALLDNNEKITAIIKRAGGLTQESFPEGATLFRVQEGIGFVVLRLDEALKNNKDRHNFILKEGDVITIPKNKDLVSIIGATKAIELYPNKIANSSKINVAHKSGKRAKWYVDEYAAGIGERGKKKLITVEHPNGEIKRTKNFLFFKVYPKVRKGSIVKVGIKPPKPLTPEGEQKREKIDWGKVLADSVAQATAILSLILLIDRVN